MKSRPYKFGKRLFRYDFDHCLVEWIYKADPEMLEDNKEWQAKYGKDLWQIEDGYYIAEAVGLRPENWKRKAVRDEYLAEWCSDIDYEAEAEYAAFVKYELPNL